MCDRLVLVLVALAGLLLKLFCVPFPLPTGCLITHPKYATLNRRAPLG